MNSDERDLRIALSLLPFLTPARTRLLREYFDPVTAACSAASTVLQSLLSVTREQADLVKAPLNSVTRGVVESVRSSVVTELDSLYPSSLREIIDPPLALHYRGDLTLAARVCVAVVGSRRASPYGVNAAAMLARDLVAAGAVVVSGLARGIDGAAHESALSSSGGTIAILGTGIDVIYPRSHAALYRKIEERGLILSEFAPGTPPLPEHFPVRNRIISGISSGTVIVEATARSGSLITARMAAEQGREVFAVPGSIFARGTEGTHRLIQYGAKLVHDVNDIVEEIQELSRVAAERTAEPEEPLREVLRALTREEATHIDALAAKLSRATGAVSESLLQLELGGWIRAVPGGRYVRVK